MDTITRHDNCVLIAYMEMITKPSQQPCKDVTTIQECYKEEAGECFTEEESLEMSAVAVVTALEGVNSEEVHDCKQELVEEGGYSLFPWLQFVKTDNNCTDDEKKEADDDLDNCVETETELFYQEMIKIPNFAKKIWSCSTLEGTVWKCIKSAEKLPKCFSSREEDLMKTELSSLISSVFQQEGCSFLHPAAGKD